MGFPRAEGHVGQVSNITFLDRELCRETLPGQDAPLKADNAEGDLHVR
jgi:hypothetical protein